MRAPVSLQVGLGCSLNVGLGLRCLEVHLVGEWAVGLDLADRASDHDRSVLRLRSHLGQVGIVEALQNGVICCTSTCQNVCLLAFRPSIFLRR